LDILGRRKIKEGENKERDDEIKIEMRWIMKL